MLSYFGTEDLETTLSTISANVTLAGGLIVTLLLLLAIFLGRDKRRTKHKLPIFVSICVVVAGTTLTITGNTIYLNLASATGGPVHWHADIEVWACGNELELRDPTGFLSNKIGTATYHEHNDKRIHLEGVPVELPDDASLGKFMRVIGGSISNNTLVVPLTEGNYFEDGHDEQDGDGNGVPAPELVEPYIFTEAGGKVARFVNGETCGSEPAQVQAFVYRYDEATKTYQQSKIEDADKYSIAPHETVPPGDCVIIEFAPAKDRTDKLCKQFGVIDIDRCEEFGVAHHRRDEVCEIKEVR